jgi:hypothetical protein
MKVAEKFFFSFQNQNYDQRIHNLYSSNLEENLKINDKKTHPLRRVFLYATFIFSAFSLKKKSIMKNAESTKAHITKKAFSYPKS